MNKNEPSFMMGVGFVVGLITVAIIAVIICS
jgi:hypothetical protein